MKVKKQLLGLFICMLMVAMMPMAAGTNVADDTYEEEPTQLGSCTLRGFITKPTLVNGGHYIQFRVLYLHYSSRSLGQTEQGVLRGFQKITLPNDFTGYLGNHWCWARFSCPLDM